MNCYSVFLNNKQIRVFHYSILERGDWKRAENLALDFADKNTQAGYPCTVEQFYMCDVGVTVSRGQE